jgi:hypothetical protein
MRRRRRRNRVGWGRGRREGRGWRRGRRGEKGGVEMQV